MFWIERFTLELLKIIRIADLFAGPICADILDRAVGGALGGLLNDLKARVLVAQQKLYTFRDGVGIRKRGADFAWGILCLFGLDWPRICDVPINPLEVLQLTDLIGEVVVLRPVVLGRYQIGHRD